MKAIKNLVVLGAIAAVCSNATAANWVFCVENKSVQIKSYLDMDSIKIYKHGRTAWIKMVYLNKETLTQFAYRCGTKQHQPLAVTEYSKQGEVISSQKFEIREKDWEEVLPQSFGEASLEMVCAF